eukprot:1027896-Alexandrium_andersonii.AAC.1
MSQPTLAWPDPPGLSLAWLCLVLLGLDLPGWVMSWPTLALPGPAGLSLAWHGRAWPCLAWTCLLYTSPSPRD